jgi:hypothetical protein
MNAPTATARHPRTWQLDSKIDEQPPSGGEHSDTPVLELRLAHPLEVDVLAVDLGQTDRVLRSARR